MKYIQEVYGSSEQAKPLIVNIDTVYVHKNIVKVEQDSEGKSVEDLYKYEEWQYTYPEYIQIMAEQLIVNSEATAELGTIVSDVKQQSDITMQAVAELGTMVASTQGE